MARKKQSYPDIASRYWKLLKHDTNLLVTDKTHLNYIEQKCRLPTEGDSPLSIEDYEIAHLFIDEYTGEESVFKYLDPRHYSQEDTMDLEQNEEGNFNEPY